MLVSRAMKQRVWAQGRKPEPGPAGLRAYNPSGYRAENDDGGSQYDGRQSVASVGQVADKDMS